MTVTIDYTTNIIYMPQADLTFLGGSLYQLDLDSFRLELKALEDNEEGIPFPNTHIHNTEVVLSGITYARVIEIIAPYTVEFEDGQYTVTCAGANHNLADVKVANQVSLIVNNAAGLISQAAIEYSSFEGAVWMDETSSTTGTVFPVGTPLDPVNNLADALLIASVRGFVSLRIVGDFTFCATDNIDDLSIYGDTPDHSLITVIAGCSTQDTHFYDCSITGVMDGAIGLQDTHLAAGGVTNFTPGHINDTVFEGDLGIVGAGTLHILNSWSGVPGHAHPDIDMGGASGPGLGVRNYNGGIGIKNLSNPRNISVDMGSGHVHLHSDVTDGTFVIRGNAKLTDESSGAADVDSTNLINALIYDVLGITGENIKWSSITHDANKNMTGATLTQYTDSTLTTVRKSWSLVATYNSESELTAYQLIED